MSTFCDLWNEIQVFYNLFIILVMGVLIRITPFNLAMLIPSSFFMPAIENTPPNIKSTVEMLILRQIYFTNCQKEKFLRDFNFMIPQSILYLFC